MDPPGRAQSRFSKALPVPPPAGDNNTGNARRGKTNAFPTAHRALPPVPASNMVTNLTIPRRPVGGSSQPETREPSIASASPSYSDSWDVLQMYESIVEEEGAIHIESERTPPLPPKDEKRHRLPNIPQEPIHQPSNSISSNTSSSSPPRPELWRRRSVKSDGSVNISDLKLSKSNGYTAPPPPVNKSPPIPTRQDSLPQVSSQPSRPVVGLPGRSIKPLAARPAPSPPDPMGSTLSSISKLERKPPSPTKDKVRNGERPTDIQTSSIKRLPTPEYEPAERYLQKSAAPQVFSPVSPQTPPRDSSPELQHDRPAFGGRSNERGDNMKMNSVDATSTQPQQSRIPSVLAIKRPTSEDSAKPTHPLPAPPTPDRVYPSLALSVVHLDCFQSHRNMRGSRNDCYPLECMVCEGKDTEKRWTCTWCSLRCCDPCMKSLASIPGKDLRKCLQWIGRTDRIVQRADVKTMR